MICPQQERTSIYMLSNGEKRNADYVWHDLNAVNEENKMLSVLFGSCTNNIRLLATPMGSSITNSPMGSSITSSPMGRTTTVCVKMLTKRSMT